MKQRRPDPSEHAPYFSRYIDLVPETDIVGALQRQHDDTQKLLASIGESRAGHRYAPDKWTIRQLVGHVEDAERVFAYRALTFARGGTTPLPGFDENVWAKNATYDSSTLRERAESLSAVRRATIALFRSLDDEAWERGGTANDNRVTVRSLAYMCVGHERHHLGILRDRYLAQTT
ncbi:MAG TPA: DinB family protein [Thermoanaerobaculia bacterium]